MRWLIADANGRLLDGVPVFMDQKLAQQYADRIGGIIVQDIDVYELGLPNVTNIMQSGFDQCVQDL